MREKPSLALHDQIPYPQPPAPPEQESEVILMLRRLYRGRFRILYYLVLFLGIGLVGFLLWLVFFPKVSEGILTLAFQGIEKHEYPSGKQFSVEDFRSPQILMNALGDIGIPKEKIDLRKIAGKVYVTPIVADEIINRWKKQERDGTVREAYYPNEYKIGIEIAGVSDEQRIRLFDALVRRYQEQVKYEQHTALGFIAGGRTDSYEVLAQQYDFWDIPSIFEDIYSSVSRQLNTLISESIKTRESRFQLKFRDLERNLQIWSGSRLESLQAVTYKGGVVKDKELILKRMGFQLEELVIRIRQKTQEAEEATRLLEKVDRPKTMLAGQYGNKEMMPMMDASALDRIVKADYVGPVVGRVSRLQEEVKALEASKARLETRLSFMPKLTNIKPGQLPPGYRELVETVSAELHGIIRDYDKLLDEYLNETIMMLVYVKQAPTISRSGLSAGVLFLLIVGASVLMAFVAISVERVFQAVKQH